MTYHQGFQMKASIPPTNPRSMPRKKPPPMTMLTTENTITMEPHAALCDG